MGAALPIDLLVEINSATVKDTFTIGKLPTLLITKFNESIPNPQFSSFSSLSGVKNAFKQGSVVDFATEYFGFTSKSGTKADYLTVFNYNTTATAGVLVGAEAPALAKVKQVNGKAKFTIDGVSADVEIDLTAAVSLTECASKISDALQTSFAGVKVEFNALTNGFIVKSSSTGATSSVDFITKADEGVDISANLGLSKAEGATSLQGLNAQTFAEALDKIENNNGNYFVIATDYQFEDFAGELETFGKWIKASNYRFLGVYSDNRLLTEDVEDFKGGLDGVLADYKLKDSQNGKVCALISSMDLSKTASNVNIAFNDFSDYSSVAITDRAVYEKLTARMVNAPCKFGVMGQDDTIYQDGSIWGSATNSANIYVGNAYLKLKEQIALYNCTKSAKLLGLRDAQTKSTLNGYLVEVFEDCVDANLIARGADLTTTEKSSLSTNFGSVVDDIENVYSAVSNNGYYFAITDIDTSAKTISITQAYMANGAIKKMIVNNYVLGA